MSLVRKCRSSRLVDLLLQNGADPSILTAYGDSAIDLVTKRCDGLHLPLLTSFVQRDMTLEWDTFCRIASSPSLSLILQKAITSGLMPVAPKHGKDVPKFSIISAALSVERVEAALYFLASGFLNTSDLKLSLSLPQYRFAIEKFKINFQDRENRYNPLLYFRQEPWPLVKLCFVAVSTLLGPSPGRKERVIATPLPPKLQRLLLFQEPIAKLCVSQWPKVSPCFDPKRYECLPKPRPLLDRWPYGRDLTICCCSHCGGEGYTFI